MCEPGSRKIKKLPTLYTRRTKGPTALLALPFFILQQGKQVVLVRTAPPDNLSANKPRRPRFGPRCLDRPPRNAIQEARRYEAFLNSDDYSYADVAGKFGVTRATVCYHISLVRRLPADFVQWLESCDDNFLVAYFNQFRLRPVARIGDPHEQKARIQAMLAEAEEFRRLNGDGHIPSTN